jgi:hypothetical protein
VAAAGTRAGDGAAVAARAVGGEAHGAVAAQLHRERREGGAGNAIVFVPGDGRHSGTDRSMGTGLHIVAQLMHC